MPPPRRSTLHRGVLSFSRPATPVESRRQRYPAASRAPPPTPASTNHPDARSRPALESRASAPDSPAPPAHRRPRRRPPRTVPRPVRRVGLGGSEPAARPARRRSPSLTPAAERRREPRRAATSGARRRPPATASAGSDAVRDRPGRRAPSTCCAAAAPRGPPAPSATAARSGADRQRYAQRKSMRDPRCPARASGAPSSTS